VDSLGSKTPGRGDEVIKTTIKVLAAGLIILLLFNLILLATDSAIKKSSEVLQWPNTSGEVEVHHFDDEGNFVIEDDFSQWYELSKAVQVWGWDPIWEQYDWIYPDDFSGKWNEIMIVTSDSNYESSHGNGQFFDNFTSLDVFNITINLRIHANGSLWYMFYLGLLWSAGGDYVEVYDWVNMTGDLTITNITASPGEHDIPTDGGTLWLRIGLWSRNPDPGNGYTGTGFAYMDALAESDDILGDNDDEQKVYRGLHSVGSLADVDLVTDFDWIGDWTEWVTIPDEGDDDDDDDDSKDEDDIVFEDTGIDLLDDLFSMFGEYAGVIIPAVFAGIAALIKIISDIRKTEEKAKSNVAKLRDYIRGNGK
jgi:hypothetical protein